MLFRTTDTTELLCTADCCKHFACKPHQPGDKAVIESTRLLVGKKKETHTFNTTWYKDFMRIHLSVTRKRVFCFHCLGCYLKGALNFTKKYNTAFIKEGFCNWKKACEWFVRHERSESHKEAVLELRSMHVPSIVAQLSVEAHLIQAEYWNMLLKQLHSLRYLLRQRLPIRGHKEEEGNLVQLLEMQSTDCPQLKHWIRDAHYLSHDIINEMVSLMGNTLLHCTSTCSEGTSC